jgi:putative transposase
MRKAREADRDPVSAVAKRHGISEQTIYTWRKRFGGFQANDVRRLKQLEAENARLKKLVAERNLEIKVMKEVAAKNWWACRLAGGKLRMAGSVVSRRGGPARCSQWRDRRCGSRRVRERWPQGGEGHARGRADKGVVGAVFAATAIGAFARMSPGRAYRLWRAARLQVPRKRPKKRITAARPRPQAPCGPNQVWSYDFVFDHCANGQPLKWLTVTDDFTKEGLAIDVDGRIRSARVIEVLSRLVSARGVPTFLRSDNGPEFVSKALLSWIVAQGIGTALIDPGKPWQNGVTESFNGKFRDECLSLEWFRSRAEAKVIIEAWRQHYNEVRPHSSLDYLTPNEFVARGARPAPREATGRDAAVHGASASRPVAQPSRRGQMQPAREAVSS